MADFFIVAEGRADQAVISNILIGYFKAKGQPEPFISWEFPNPQIKEDGGWTRTMNYLHEKKFLRELQFFPERFLIIHFDTDISQDIGFDVPHNDVNGPVQPEALVERVINRLRTEIGEQDWDKYSRQFIFAIAVDGNRMLATSSLGYERCAKKKDNGLFGNVGKNPSFAGRVER